MPFYRALFGIVCFLSTFLLGDLLNAEEVRPPLPKFYLNGRPAPVTVQDLSGLSTRPLRILVQRNNRARQTEFIQTYAIGVKAGDALTAELTVPSPGVRATIYKIIREKKGPRYLSMPFSAYFAEPDVSLYEEQIGDFKEEVFVVIFEKVQSPDEMNVQIRYFQDQVRQLVLASYKTNLMLSSLKFKMKEFGENGTKKFFERDAQLLVDRLSHPQQIFLIRLWRADD